MMAKVFFSDWRGYKGWLQSHKKLCTGRFHIEEIRFNLARESTGTRLFVRICDEACKTGAADVQPRSEPVSAQMKRMISSKAAKSLAKGEFLHWADTIAYAF